MQILRCGQENGKIRARYSLGESRIVSTLLNIIRSQWERREQIFNLALFDLKKQARGAALGWFWFFAKPLVYIFVFWFALQIGLKTGSSSVQGAPYILWLMAGLIPWFYMQNMLGAGTHVLKRFSYLVNKIKFPIAGIPTIYAISLFVIHCGLVIFLLAVYFFCGLPLDLYLLQIPFGMILMFAFFYMFSLTSSLLSAISKDFQNLMTTLSTPLFWLSGIIFNVFDLGIGWLETILMFNPITFIVTIYRCAIYDRAWIWEQPVALVGFAVVFVATLVLMTVVYKRTAEEVPDVL